MGACLEGPPPLSLPLGTLAAGTGSVGPCLPAARVGRPRTGLPARGGTEAPLSLLSGPVGTIATLRTRNVAGMLLQEVTSPLLPPPHASPALLTCSPGYLFQDNGHVQNGHFVFHLLPRGSLLCARTMLSLGIREESTWPLSLGRGLGRRQRAHRLCGASLVLRVRVAQCLPGRPIRKASWKRSHSSEVFLQPESQDNTAIGIRRARLASAIGPMASALWQAKARAIPDSTPVLLQPCAVFLWDICTGRIFRDHLGLECQHKSCVPVTPSPQPWQGRSHQSYTIFTCQARMLLQNLS